MLGCARPMWKTADAPRGLWLSSALVPAMPPTPTVQRSVGAVWATDMPCEVAFSRFLLRAWCPNHCLKERGAVQ